MATRLISFEELRLLRDEARRALGGHERWRHLGTGDIYVVDGMSWRDGEWQVHYYPALPLDQDPIYFGRSTTEFLRKYEPVS